jgi:hypothetical protein
MSTQQMTDIAYPDCIRLGVELKMRFPPAQPSANGFLGSFFFISLKWFDYESRSPSVLGSIIIAWNFCSKMALA